MYPLIDPWSSEDIVDYKKLIESFGMEPFDPMGLTDMPPVMRRGYVVGQRGFRYIRDAILKHERFAMLTGLMPSGKMHFGHKMVIDQVIYYQRMEGDIFIAVADIEAYATRDMNLRTAREIAVEEYVKGYIALGLNPNKCEIYFQSERNEVKDLAWILGRNTNLTTLRAIYGFEDSTNLAHVISPLIQVGDILHVQLEKYGGPRPTIVPVGLDQDPHIRFTRDVAMAARLYSVQETKNGLGVFLKGHWSKSCAKDLLKKAEKKLLDVGYADIDIDIPYRALYIYSGDDPYRVMQHLADIETDMGTYGFLPPSATYHRFMRGLMGGKMSSSKPESAIFLSDDINEAKSKIMRAYTGGRTTAQEQRRYGGVPEKCNVFEMMLVHLVLDDNELDEIYNSCRDGTMLCGQCKKIAAQHLETFLSEFQERKASIDVKDVEACVTRVYSFK